MAKEIIDGLDDDFFENTIQLSFKDRIHYNNVKKIMISTLFEKNDETTKASETSNHSKKILSFFQSKKNKFF